VPATSNWAMSPAADWGGWGWGWGGERWGGAFWGDRGAADRLVGKGLDQRRARAAHSTQTPLKMRSNEDRTHLYHRHPHDAHLVGGQRPGLVGADDGGAAQGLDGGERPFGGELRGQGLG
jgi:hypothetical protein